MYIKLSWRKTTGFIGNKLQNRNMRAYNGNHTFRNNVQFAQWNMGRGNWESKMVELEAQLLLRSPDIIYITEATLHQSVPEYARQIRGYQMFIPEDMMEKHEYVCIVMLVKDGIEVKLLR